MISASFFKKWDMASSRAGSDLSQYIKKLHNIKDKKIKVYIEDYIYGDNVPKGQASGRRWITGLITSRLWTKGQSGDGSILPKYPKRYADWKRKQGHKRVGLTTLNLTGSWYKSLFAWVWGERKVFWIDIKVRDSDPENQRKTEALKRKYGASILKLLPEEQKRVADQLQAYVQKRVNDELAGGVKINFY